MLTEAQVRELLPELGQLGDLNGRRTLLARQGGFELVRVKQILADRFVVEHVTRPAPGWGRPQ